MVGLTELHRVQRCDVTAERLHREDGDLVADISGGPTHAVVSRMGTIDRCGFVPRGGLWHSPRDNLCIMSARIFALLSLCIHVYMLGGQMLGLNSCDCAYG